MSRIRVTVVKVAPGLKPESDKALPAAGRGNEVKASRTSTGDREKPFRWPGIKKPSLKVYVSLNERCIFIGFGGQFSGAIVNVGDVWDEWVMDADRCRHRESRYCTDGDHDSFKPGTLPDGGVPLSVSQILKSGLYWGPRLVAASTLAIISLRLRVDARDRVLQPI